MPDSSDSAKPLDLSDLHMAPDWVTELDSGTSSRNYERFETDRPERPGGGYRDRDSRGGTHGGPGGGGGFGRGNFRGAPGGGGGGGYRRDGGPGSGPRRDGPGGGPRRDGPGGGPRRDDRGPRRDDRGGDFRGRRDDRGPRETLPQGIVASVRPTHEALHALVSRIKMSGRAFAMFDMAKVVLGGRERFEMQFSRENQEQAPRLVRCKSDGSLWLAKEDALRHFMASGGVEQYYDVVQMELEPPKGEFAAVAVCGFSGALLGPPNHHSFQTAVVRLHRQRFSDMPIERYKARIRTEANEELVNKWKETVSKATHYLYPKTVEEGQTQERLESQEALERHVNNHLANEVLETVDRATVAGNVPGKNLAPGLLILLRQEVEQLKRSPFPLVKVLCGALESQGLKIFKRQGKKLFVSKARPRALDPAMPLSDSVRKIVDAIAAQPGIRVSELVTSLAPRPRNAPEEEKQKTLTPEETAVLSDLHWLIDEGFVIEYASSALFLGERPRKAKEGGGGAAATESEAEGEDASPDEAHEEQVAIAVEERPVDLVTEDHVEEAGAVSDEDAPPAMALIEDAMPEAAADEVLSVVEAPESPVEAAEGSEATFEDAELVESVGLAVARSEEALAEEPPAPQIAVAVDQTPVDLVTQDHIETVELNEPLPEEEVEDQPYAVTLMDEAAPAPADETLTVVDGPKEEDREA